MINIFKKFYKPVFDLIDCGPNSRFAIINDRGELVIVHNCENLVQSVARTAVAEQAINIAKELPVVLLVHDEIVALAAEEEADQALAFMVAEMSKAPDWCADIPLAAEGKHSKCYMK